MKGMIYERIFIYHNYRCLSFISIGMGSKVLFQKETAAYLQMEEKIASMVDFFRILILGLAY